VQREEFHRRNTVKSSLWSHSASISQGNMGGIQDPIGDVLRKTEKKVPTSTVLLCCRSSA